ncbi:hypothetical protein EHQ59_09520 [Leptospira kemamanensis]|uniref:Porin n=1 Tax=Leptospira kemamanensis TaxID=2484942 RepID=A0A4R9JP50_9LEPT|nr:hypothetical protein [Leptospira kemamanensis]TGL52283.1 hypothetical protein EHQ59_09520 [Leptospira kemamanensis]
MSHNKIILTLVTLFLSFGNLFAKDYDSTHELPEVKQPDKHRVFLRLTDGFGTLYIPEKDYTRNEDISGYAVRNTPISGFDLYSFSQQIPKFDATSSGRELEYRNQDKFRFFYETRNLVNVGKPASDDVYRTKFSEKQNSVGFAYFHPLTPNFNVGASLRYTTVDQLTKTNPFSQSLVGNNFIYAISPRDAEMSAKGFVPGVHLEFKPLRWFEIHLGQQFYMLKGSESRPTIFLAAGGGASAGGAIFESADVTYTGTKQNLDFVFRFSSWFATKWGYSRERMLVRSSNPLSIGSGFSAANSVSYALWNGAQTQKFDLTALNLTFEFSKSFGE